MKNMTSLSNADIAIGLVTGGSELKLTWLTQAEFWYRDANMPQHAQACRIAVKELGQSHQTTIANKVANLVKLSNRSQTNGC